MDSSITTCKLKTSKDFDLKFEAILDIWIIICIIGQDFKFQIKKNNHTF